MYKLLDPSLNIVKHLDTNQDIPMVDGNKEYELYKVWLSEGNTPEPEFTAVELLANAKVAKLQEIETAYQTAITADIAYNTIIFQADQGSMELMAQNLSVGSVPTGFYWRALDNSKVPMTFAELQGLASAIQSRGMLAFDVRVNRKDLLLAATTIAQVEVI